MEKSLGSAFVAVFAVSGSVVLLAMRVHKHLLSDFMNKLQELEIEENLHQSCFANLWQSTAKTKSEDKDQAKKKIIFSKKVVELGAENNKDDGDDHISRKHRINHGESSDDESLESMPLNWQALYKGILHNKTLRGYN